MSVMVLAKLKAGVIFGDNENREYVYLPGSEIGSENPLCVLERGDDYREDNLSLAEADTMIRKLSLRPVKHPRLGATSC